jgi:hypothetical protein
MDLREVVEDMVEADEPEGSSWCVGLQPLWLCEHDVEWWMIRGWGMDVVEWWSMLMLILRNTRHHDLGGEFKNILGGSATTLATTHLPQAKSLSCQ